MGKKTTKSELAREKFLLQQEVERLGRQLRTNEERAQEAIAKAEEPRRPSLHETLNTLVRDHNAFAEQVNVTLNRVIGEKQVLEQRVKTLEHELGIK